MGATFATRLRTWRAQRPRPSPTVTAVSGLVPPRPIDRRNFSKMTQQARTGTTAFIARHSKKTEQSNHSSTRPPALPPDPHGRAGRKLGSAPTVMQPCALNKNHGERCNITPPPAKAAGDLKNSSVPGVPTKGRRRYSLKDSVSVSVSVFGVSFGYAFGFGLGFMCGFDLRAPAWGSPRAARTRHPAPYRRARRARSS